MSNCFKLTRHHEVSHVGLSVSSMASHSFEDIPEEVVTVIRQPIASTQSPRNKGTTKKEGKGASSRSSPYKNFGTTSGLQSSKNTRELWLAAVKGGGTGTGTKKGQTAKSTATQRWTDTLRRTGVGITAETMGKRDSMSNLKKHTSHDMSYSSTSHYLRQLAGTEKLSKTTSLDTSSPKPAPGTPVYKSQEEYYEQVLGLKKQIQQMNSDTSTLKLKIRRIEEDNLKKEREIEQLLDPSKSEEMRRTLTDRRPDTGTVIHSLKQKILKLEHQLKDREAAFSKLQSDIKTTKMEELKTQSEMLYREVLRLNQLKSSPVTSDLSRSASTKEKPSKIKALQETVVRMNEKNVRLQTENKTLRQDLHSMMEDKATQREKKMEYDDMSKKELLNAVAKLEKRLDNAENDNLSIVSEVEGRRDAVEGKMVLEGSVSQRLDQLDRRETDLLEDLSKQRSLVKRLKEDRSHYRKKCDEKDREIKSLKKEMDELQAEVDGFYDKDKAMTPRASSRSTTARKDSPATDKERLRRAEKLKENRAAKQIQRGWRSHHEKQKVNEEEEKREEAQRVESQVMALSEAHAARTIQKQWRSYKVKEAEQYEQEEAAVMIQSAMRGHKTRQANLQRMRGFMAEDDLMETTTESELEDATGLLQSSLRGHSYRKDYIKRGSLHDAPRSPSPRQFTPRSQSPRQFTPRSQSPRQLTPRNQSPLTSRYSSPRRLDSEGEEEESDDIHSAPSRPTSRRRSSVDRPSNMKTPPGSRPSSNPRSKPRSPLIDSDDEDDDDLIVTSGKKFF